jgi:hypothetical protein
MSLAFQFKLTPAQSHLLLVCAFGHYSRTEGEPSPLLPDHKSPFFVTTAGTLISKGLLSHDTRREPTYSPTPAGIAVANLIVGEARKIVELAETAKPLPKAVGRNRHVSHN